MVSISAIAAAMNSAATVITASSALFSFVGDLMETVEAAYAAVPNSGATKKSMVLAGLSAIASTLAINFSSIEAQLSAWINTVKTAYNAAKTALAGSSAPVVDPAPAA